MPNSTTPAALLQDCLQPHLAWNKARLSLFARFVVALIHVRTVSLPQIALALNGEVETSSNYRRLQRFLAAFTVDPLRLARLLLAFLPKEARQNGLLLVIDRTNWKFGKTEINLLVVAVAYRSVAIPLIWQVLDHEGKGKAGNSSTQERIKLMKQVLELLQPEEIQGVLADREFIGRQWFEYLIEQRIRFYIRLRKNTLVEYPHWMKGADAVPLSRFFNKLKPGEIRFIGGVRRSANYRVFGHRLHLLGLKCQSDDVLIATNADPAAALAIYRRRWEIECMFKAMKSSGFCFEQTHVTEPDRLSKLVAVMSVALLWAHRVGDGLELVKPSKPKRHGRRAQSIFRRGLDHLMECLINLHIPRQSKRLIESLRILSCT